MARRWVRRTTWCAVGAGVLWGIHLVNRPAAEKPAPTAGAHSVVSLPGYSSNGALSSPSKSDLAQVTQDLDDQAKAVKAGDRATYLGAVDTDRRPFLAAQRVVWNNTQQLHFDTLSYHVDGAIEPDHILRTPSLVVKVTTTYQIHGFDSSPIALEGGFTFVKQDGTWKLASESDASSSFNQDDLPAPWQGRAISTYGNARYLAIVDRGRLALAHDLVALCQHTARASGTLLGVANRTPTLVIATSHAAGFKTFSSPDTAALTYAPQTTDGGYSSGWRMVLNPEYVDQVATNPIVLTHELTHLAMQRYLRYLPAWLSEGSAEYVAWHDHGGVSANASYRGMHPHSLDDRIPGSAGFYASHVSRNYVEGHALVSYLVAHYGTAKVLALLHAFETAGTSDARSDPDVTSPHLLHSVLGTNDQALARAAYASLVSSGSGHGGADARESASRP